MNDNTKQILEALIPQVETRETIQELLSLKDEQFNAIEPDLSKTIQDTLNDPTIDRAEINKELSRNPIEHQDLVDTITQANGVVDADETLSIQKKSFLKKLFQGSVDMLTSIQENPRQKVKVQIKKLSPDAVLPTYAHDYDAGADIYTIKDEHIPAHKTQIIDTGFAVGIPKGYEIQIRARSGMSLKTKIRIANAIGTIDCGYHNGVGVIVDNISSKPIDIPKGTRIAQMLIKEIPMIEWEEVDELSGEDRGGGFGSTDKKDEKTED